MAYFRLGLLFVFFVFAMLGVRKLDAHSALYVDCAEIWLSSTDAAIAYGDQAEFRKTINQGQLKTPFGETCPALLTAHKDVLLAKLATE